MKTLKNNLEINGHYGDSSVYGLVIGTTKKTITFIDLDRLQKDNFKLYTALTTVAQNFIDCINKKIPQVTTFKSFLGDYLNLFENYIKTLIITFFTSSVVGVSYIEPVTKPTIRRYTKRKSLQQ